MTLVATCGEPHHTKGLSPKPCRICLVPVCEGCIVKTSFGRPQVTLQMCRVYFCTRCWIAPEEPHVADPDAKVLGARTQPGEVQSVCVCSAQDKWLCQRCKLAQRSEPGSCLVRCAGDGCSTIMEPSQSGYCICLLCGLQHQPGLGTLRREYDSAHLYARYYSAINYDASEHVVREPVELVASLPSRNEPWESSRPHRQVKIPLTQVQKKPLKPPKSEKLRAFKNVLKRVKSIRARPCFIFLHEKRSSRGYSKI